MRKYGISKELKPHLSLKMILCNFFLHVCCYISMYFVVWNWKSEYLIRIIWNKLFPIIWNLFSACSLT